MSFSISVVIPVKNEVNTIRDCIEGILKQTVSVDEIIVIDSGSTDGTLEILGEYSHVKVISIAPESFNHGSTRNQGVREAKGELVVLTVGDARPANDQWIEELLEGFTSENVAGVCGQQVVPHERDKNPAEWFRPQSRPGMQHYHFDSPEAFHRLEPEEKKQVCSWDDVTAMYRREVLLKHPFPRTTYMEDAMWAKNVFLEGYALVYNKAAQVYHYHERSYLFAFKRTLTSGYYRYKTFGTVPDPIPAKRYARWVYILLRESRISWSEKAYWAVYNAKIWLAIYQAVRSFRAALSEGEEVLEALHARHCGKPPIPEKVDRERGRES